MDVIIYPTWSNPPRKVGDMQSPAGDNSQTIPPHTGMPGISVPMGYVDGRWPAGLQMVGRLFDEPTLIRVAYAYEQATRHRRPPERFPGARARSTRRGAGGRTPSPFSVEVQKTPVEASFRGLRAVSDKVAWASGSRGAVCRTMDGGATWVALERPGRRKTRFPDAGRLRRRHGPSSPTPGAPDSSSRRSTGEKPGNPAYKDERPGFFIDALVFWDEKRGLAVGDPIDGAFLALATEDGGETWAPLGKGSLARAE